MTMNATMATGTFTKNTQRQPMESVMSPPTTGPMTELIPKTAPVKPWYRPRSRGEKMSPMVEKAMLMSAPPPMPCRARKAMSCGMFCERPLRTLASVNTTMPNCRMCLRP